MGNKNSKERATVAASLLDRGQAANCGITPRVLSEKQLATELGLSPWTVRTLRLQSGLPHFRTAGRIFYRLEAIISWMEKMEQSGNKTLPESEYGVLRQIK